MVYHHRAEPADEFGERGLVPSPDEPSKELAVGRAVVAGADDGPGHPGDGGGQGGVGHRTGSGGVPPRLAIHYWGRIARRVPEKRENA
jgi:hypothetical protein